ncbi:hypothetical protein SAMN06295912_104170 [Sphingomonas laterariae]|uniref:N-acyl amino acid synthase FeeM catalytic core domain-containing protein n=2 Tax=Edaphosphingomonas laterariae TaxID=861865 RepID=A0A239DNG0_9SPHN|nr:hypothetical protein SAMN06295912_104170 [Sphingomonas laterariae]
MSQVDTHHQFSEHYQAGISTAPLDDELFVEFPYTDHDGEQKYLTFHIANTKYEKDSASDLINRMYSWRGYGRSDALPSGENSTTFTITSDDRVVGTLTLTADSGAGLAIEKTFHDDIDGFRRMPGNRLCELTKFALDTNAPSKPVLAALFHIIFIYGMHRYDCTDLFIEVNPRHSRFYEVMLNFKPVGDVKMNDSVKAPSQLLWLRSSDIREYIDVYTNNLRTSKRSLYPYFYPLAEEADIYTRMLRAPANDMAIV